jgi:hypothetical protein
VKLLWSVWESGKNCFDFQQEAVRANVETDESLMKASVKVSSLSSLYLLRAESVHLLGAAVQATLCYVGLPSAPCGTVGCTCCMYASVDAKQQNKGGCSFSLVAPLSVPLRTFLTRATQTARLLSETAYADNGALSSRPFSEALSDPQMQYTIRLTIVLQRPTKQIFDQMALNLFLHVKRH